MSCVLSSGAGAGARDSLWLDIRQESSAGPHGGFFLAQAQSDQSTNSTPLEDVLAEATDSEIVEELLAQFLADPTGFLADPGNADMIAAVVRLAISRNPASVDLVIVAVERISDTAILNAVADGIVRAAADYAASGETIASSQILAKASISTSTGLRQAVQTKTSQVAAEIASDADNLQVVSEEETSVDAQEGESPQETSTLPFDAETLSPPVNDAPALGATTATTGGGANTVVPGSGNTPPPAATRPQQAPANLPPRVAPPAIDSAASPA